MKTEVGEGGGGGRGGSSGGRGRGAAHVDRAVRSSGGQGQGKELFHRRNSCIKMSDRVPFP